MATIGERRRTNITWGALNHLATVGGRHRARAVLGEAQLHGDVERHGVFLLREVFDDADRRVDSLVCTVKNKQSEAWGLRIKLSAP